MIMKPFGDEPTNKTHTGEIISSIAGGRIAANLDGC
jgi:hypothetical protein